MMRVERPKERSLDDWGLACLMCFNVLGKLIALVVIGVGNFEAGKSVSRIILTDERPQARGRWWIRLLWQFGR
jgi:hypothetical protein